MARPIKQGLSYFPFDVSFFSDRKVRKIIRGCGPGSPTILICLLCNIYEDQGYYILWDEELPFDIADTVGVSEGAVKELIKKAVDVDFFDKEMFEKEHILTSRGVQSRFIESTRKRKDVTIKKEYWIISGDNSVIDVNNQVNDVNNEQRKEKKSKESLSSERDKKSAPEGASRSPDHPGFHSEKVEKPLDECKAFVLDDLEWVEVVRMQQYIDQTDFNAYLDEFFRDLACRNVRMKSPEDAKSHFASWLSIKLEKLRRNAGNKKNNTSTVPKQYGEY